MEGSKGFSTYLEEELKLKLLGVEKKRFKYADIQFGSPDREPTYSSGDVSVYTYTDGDITFQMVPEDSLLHVFLLPNPDQNRKLAKLCQKMDVTQISGEAIVESCDARALFDALKKVLPERDWVYQPLLDISDTESVFSSASDLSRINVSLLYENEGEILVTATFYVTSYERLKVNNLEDLLLVQKVMEALSSQGLPNFQLKGGKTFQGF
jgi:hypothetical protein